MDSPQAGDEMRRFQKWLQQFDRPIFVSNNPAFDWQFINYYFHSCIGENPFGYSAHRLGGLYAGMQGDVGATSRWKNLHQTRHTHNPVDGAMGFAEALLEMKKLGLKVPF